MELKSPDLKGKPYSDRAQTPLGEETGLTSKPVSEQTTPRSQTPQQASSNPYHYQPAIDSTHPHLTALRRRSSNYAQAQVESMSKMTSLRDEAVRSFSFSLEDFKRRRSEHLMRDDTASKEEKAVSPTSPGIGNSELEGREYGFSSKG
jgi:hypothetical protein